VDTASVRGRARFTASARDLVIVMIWSGFILG
jgi:hypothetical protein